MKNKEISLLKRITFVLKRIYKFDKPRIIQDISYQILSKLKMYIFGIYYPLYIFNAVQEGTEFKVVIKYILMALVINLGIDVYVGLYINYLKPNSDIKIMEKCNKEIFEKSTQMDIANYEDTGFYEKYNRTINNVKERFLPYENSMLDCLFDALYIALTITVMSKIDFFILIFVIIPMIFSFLIGKMINKTQYEYNMIQMNINRRKDYVKNTFYLKEYSKEIRLTKISSVLLNYFKEAFYDGISNIKKYGFKIGNKKAIIEILGRYLIYISALIYITYNAVVLKKINVGEFYFLLFSIVTLSWYLTGTIRNYLEINNNSLYINDYMSFLSQMPTIATSKGIKNINLSHIVIEFKNVSFKYSESVKYSLQNINLVIKNNEKVALVGYNGAGKTTIIKLLLRLYDVSDGEILLNGVNIKKFDLDYYRQLFGVVFQDFQIYAMSAADNITMGDNYCEENLIVSAKKAEIYDKILKCESGMNSSLTKEFDNDGVVLSGGEEQKLAIARNFYSNRKISIFDEPSSALDAYAERQVLEKMLEGSNDRITIFISHRLSSAILADNVYLIENGEIAEHGNHEQLIEKKGEYNRIFTAQAINYMD